MYAKDLSAALPGLCFKSRRGDLKLPVFADADGTEREVSSGRDVEYGHVAKRFRGEHLAGDAIAFERGPQDARESGIVIVDRFLRLNEVRRFSRGKAPTNGSFSLNPGDASLDVAAGAKRGRRRIRAPGEEYPASFANDLERFSVKTPQVSFFHHLEVDGLYGDVRALWPIRPGCSLHGVAGMDMHIRMVETDGLA